MDLMVFSECHHFEIREVKSNNGSRKSTMIKARFLDGVKDPIVFGTIFVPIKLGWRTSKSKARIC